MGRKREIDRVVALMRRLALTQPGKFRRFAAQIRALKREVDKKSTK